MKRKLLFIIVVITIVTGYNAYTSLNKEVRLSDLALANVEAFANDNESGSGIKMSCYSYVNLSVGERYYVNYCGACGIPVECTTYSNVSSCTWFK